MHPAADIGLIGHAGQLQRPQVMNGFQRAGRAVQQLAGGVDHHVDVFQPVTPVGARLAQVQLTTAGRADVMAVSFQALTQRPADEAAAAQEQYLHCAASRGAAGAVWT